MNNSASQNFGKDLGLVSEAIVTGRKVGAGKEFWTVLAHNLFIFRLLVKWFKSINKDWDGNGTKWFSTDQRKAAKIMGKNFISPWAIMSTLPNEYTYALEQLLDLGRIPFSIVTLKECKDTHVLVPGINITAANLYEIFPSYTIQNHRKNVRNTQDRWQNEISVRWYLIRKEEVPGSHNKIFSEQIKMLADDEELPKAPVLYYAAVMCKAYKNNPILPNQVRSSDTITNNKHISVRTDGWNTDYAFLDSNLEYDFLGIASMKKQIF